MKTIEELYNEIIANEELKARCIEAATAGKQEEFLKEHGCDATLEEVAAFLNAKGEKDAPPCPWTSWTMSPGGTAASAIRSSRMDHPRSDPGGKANDEADT